MKTLLVSEQTIVAWLDLRPRTLAEWRKNSWLPEPSRVKSKAHFYDEQTLNAWLEPMFRNMEDHEPITVSWLRLHPRQLWKSPKVCLAHGLRGNYELGDGRITKTWPHLLLPNGERRYFADFVRQHPILRPQNVVPLRSVMAMLGYGSWYRFRNAGALQHIALRVTEHGQLAYTEDDVIALLTEWHPPHTPQAARVWLRMFYPQRKWHLVSLARAAAVAEIPYATARERIGSMPHLKIPDHKIWKYRIPIEVVRARWRSDTSGQT